MQKKTDSANMTTNKWLATRNFINLWLTDQTVYCNNCGMNFDANYLKYESCCQNPQFGRNFDHMYGLYKQNKERRKHLKDNYGATDKTKHMRVCISLPPRLLEDLERFFKQHGEKFLNNYDELMEFAKRFPEFRVPEKS